MINSQNLNPDSLRRMLGEIGELAENSALTGNEQGRVRLAKHYNSILLGMQAQGIEGSQMFSTLDEESSDFGTISVESQMLFSATGPSHKEKRKERHRDSEGDVDWLCGIAPFLDRSDLELLIEDKLGDNVRISDEALPALAPFVGKEFLGKMVRKRFAKPQPQPTPEPKEPEAPAASSLVFAWDSKPAEPPKPSVTDEVTEIVSRMRSDLSDVDRDRLQQTLSRVLKELESQ